MKKLLLLILFFSPLTTFAMSQSITSVTSGNVSTSLFYPLGQEAAAYGAVTNSDTPAPIAGTIDDMIASATVAPGGTATWTVELFVNNVATSLVCVVNSLTPCSDQSDSVSVNAQDLLSWEAIAANSPVATQIKMSVRWTAASSTVFSGGSLATVAATSLFYVPINAPTQAVPPILNTAQYSSDTGTFSQLCSYASISLKTGTTSTMALMDNSATTSLTTTVTGSPQVSCDTTDTASVTKGDMINYVQQNAGVQETYRYYASMVYASSTNAAYYQTFGGSYGVQTGTINPTYTAIIGAGAASQSGVEASTTVLMTETTNFYGMNIFNSVAPGAAKSWLFVLNDNGVNTPVQCLITGASQKSCTVTGFWQAKRGDLIDIEEIPTGTPANSRIYTSLLMADPQAQGVPLLTIKNGLLKIKNARLEL